jgi:hypothetical protein
MLLKLIFKIFLLLMLLNLLPFKQVYGQTDKNTYFFYQGKNYGSEAFYHPLRVIINGGFGIMQISNRPNDLSTVNFKNGFDNVMYNLARPMEVISQFGWERFLTREIIPTSIHLKNAQYYPNYELHMVGGGFTYRAFIDWYRWHHYPRPRLWALTSWFAYHFLNEIVENNAYVGPNVDPIADIYIFNTAGLLLFSFDGVARFFSHTLHMQDWSFMPGYDPVLNTIENNGQNFIIKFQLPFLDRWSYFHHWGVNGMFGLSYLRDDGTSISFGGGLVAKELIAVENNSGVRELTATLVWTAGIFYDRNNSLLASLILAGTKGYKARLNLYPGLLRTGKFSTGFFMNLRKDNQIVVGVHFNFLPVGITTRIN